MMPEIATFSSKLVSVTSSDAVLPLGVSILTLFGNSPVIRAVYDAVIAAVAHVPVVQPKRRLVVKTLAMKLLPQANENSGLP